MTSIVLMLSLHSAFALSPDLLNLAGSYKLHNGTQYCPKKIELVPNSAKESVAVRGDYNGRQADLYVFKHINQGVRSSSLDFGSHSQIVTSYEKGTLSEYMRSCTGVVFLSCKSWGSPTALIKVLGNNEVEVNTGYNSQCVYSK